MADQPQSPSHQDQHENQSMAFWKTYMQVSTGFNNYLDQKLRTEADVKLQDYSILLVLAKDLTADSEPEVVRMGELATELSVSPSRLTYQVDRLIQAGWINRQEVEQDRRGKGVYLTSTGFEKFTKAFEIHMGLVNSMVMDELSEHDKEVVLSTMLKIRAKISGNR